MQKTTGDEFFEVEVNADIERSEILFGKFSTLFGMDRPKPFCEFTRSELYNLFKRLNVISQFPGVLTNEITQGITQGSSGDYLRLRTRSLMLFDQTNLALAKKYIAFVFNRLSENRYYRLRNRGGFYNVEFARFKYTDYQKIFFAHYSLSNQGRVEKTCGYSIVSHTNTVPYPMNEEGL